MAVWFILSFTLIYIQNDFFQIQKKMRGLVEDAKNKGISTIQVRKQMMCKKYIYKYILV